MTDLAPSWRPRPPLPRTAVARLVQVAGLFDVFTAVLPPHHGSVAALAEFVPSVGIVSARVGTAVIGALLVHLGAGLRHGRRRAWQLAVVLAALGIVLHVAKGLDLDAAALSAALLVLLVAVRRQFRAPADRRSRWRALTAFAGFAGTGAGLGFLEIAVRQDRLVGAPGVLAWVQEAVWGLAGVSGPVRFASPIADSVVSLTTGAFGLLAVTAAVVLLLRPGTRRPQRTGAEDEQLRDLLARHGRNDSLSYFALRDDKSLIWAPSRSAVIAYRVVNGVSLAAGDPIGIESAWPEAIGAWLADCARHGWTPAVLGCGRAAGRAYQRFGLDVVELGDEAILDLGRFTLDGRAMRGVRQAVGRMHRAGFTCTAEYRRDLEDDELAEIVRAADTSRGDAGERGFSMALSRLGDPRDGDCMIVVCRDAGHRIRGVLQWVPWGSDGLSLDLMRSDRGAGNGVIELMVTATAAAAAEQGVRRMSLNFAVLRSVFARADELGAGPVLRAWHRVLLLASRMWQIESLYRANAKYRPDWEPRYLCFPTARDLPRIAVAALSAEAFLPTVDLRAAGRRIVTPRLGGRKPHGDHGAAERAAVAQLGLAAVGDGHGPDDGQSQAGPGR